MGVKVTRFAFGDAENQFKKGRTKKLYWKNIGVIYCLVDKWMRDISLIIPRATKNADVFVLLCNSLQIMYGTDSE